MTDPVAQTPPRVDRLSLLLGPAAIIALLAIISGWTGDDLPHAGIDIVWTLLTSAPLAIGWLAAAVGLGWPLRLLLAPKAEEALALQAAMGVAALLTIDAALGALGLLQVGGALGAWAVLAIGWVLLAEQLRRRLLRAFRKLPARRGEINIPPPHWIYWTAAPAIAVLLAAACSAPGWLWHSEFGGYDALSYHLQLPKEWLALGQIAGLEHNVYSFLPGYVEAAFYHLAVLRGDGAHSAYAAQLLHAGITVLTALLVARLTFRHGGPRQRLIAALAFVFTIATPWSVLVGSLAYNEMAVAMMLAAGLLALGEPDISPARKGACIGLLAAAACGAKLTAAGFVAVPLGLLYLVNLRRNPLRQLPAAVLLASGVGLLCLSPYLIRNGLQTGNPLFPFFSGLFGLGHWSAEQAATFHAGHVSDLALPARLIEAGHQLLHYGIGPNPYPGPPAEPWHPQWSILPWLTVIGLMICALRSDGRHTASRAGVILLLQVVFWLFFTHVKSRFMIPAIVPAAMVAAVTCRILTEKLEAGSTKRIAALVLAAVTTAYACVVLVLFSGEPYRISDQHGPGPASRIGRMDLMRGETLNAEQRRELVRYVPFIYINHELPADARVLLIGEAAVFYYDDNVSYQTTWDRGPLSRAMRQSPEDPRSWFESLRGQGFTHLLVNDEMLDRWERAGWNDPNITSDRIHEAAQRYTRIQRTWPNLRTTLYTLTALD